MGKCDWVRQATPIPSAAGKTGLSAKGQITPGTALDWNKRANDKQTETGINESEKSKKPL